MSEVCRFADYISNFQYSILTITHATYYRIHLHLELFLQISPLLCQTEQHSTSSLSVCCQLDSHATASWIIDDYSNATSNAVVMPQHVKSFKGKCAPLKFHGSMQKPASNFRDHQRRRSLSIVIDIAVLMSLTRITQQSKWSRKGDRLVLLNITAVPRGILTRTHS